MFVRWKKQKRSTKERSVYFLDHYLDSKHPQYTEKESSLLSAYLVESTRIDGKPTQKILSYLGSINEAKIINLRANEGFWKSVETHLKALHLKPDQRNAIRQKLQQRVPKVPESEIYKISRLTDSHPRSRSKKEREQLEAFREKYSLPGDDIRTM